jgi:hypothetical protein
VLPLSRKVYNTLSRIYDFDDEKIDPMSHNLYFCFHSITCCRERAKLWAQTQNIHLTSSHAYKLLQIFYDICKLFAQLKILKLFCVNFVHEKSREFIEGEAIELDCI